MAYTSWLDTTGALLGPTFPLPLDQPFTRTAAIEAGCSPRDLQAMVRDGLLRKVLRGVYAAAQAPDTVRFRTTALGLVIPAHALIIGRTAGWLHGMPVLQRGAHLEAPLIELGNTNDSRCVRPGVDGRRRVMLPRDFTVVDGLQVTTPVRTALDLGRLLWRFDGLAALDAALRLGVDPEELALESLRFKGYRGVRQLRFLLPLADGRAESPAESALRLHWHLAGLPTPELQIWIHDDHGVRLYRLDIGLPELRYSAEYDGVEHHSEEEDVEYDAKRRDWVRRNRGWIIDPFEKDAVYGMETDVQDRLRAGFNRARRGVSFWTP
jgi:very-short-patch-repair endonuclease